jgi:hypothetical protein
LILPAGLDCSSSEKIVWCLDNDGKEPPINQHYFCNLFTRTVIDRLSSISQLLMSAVILFDGWSTQSCEYSAVQQYSSSR